MSSVKAERLTFEAYLALPETKQRYEIVDGVLIMPPAPTPDHQWIMLELSVRLRSFVVEVLSPSNTRHDIENKLEDYRQIGVKECWLVSPEAETIEVLSLSAAEATSAGVFGIDGILRSEVLSDFTLRLRDVFR